MSRLAVAISLWILVLPQASHAECAKDNIGRVLCAAEPGGGAAVDGIGRVLCGKGQCRKNGIGIVYCSKVRGGGAETDGIDTVRCLGGCEQGSQNMCVPGEQ